VSETRLDIEDRRARLLSMVRPLRFIFWGGLLCLFDLSISWVSGSSGFRFDFLNDFLGMILISFGIFRLSRIGLEAGHPTSMNFVKVVSVISTFKALVDHVIFEAPTSWVLFWMFFVLAQLAAILVFCSTMRTLCRREYLDEAARSWATTTMLFTVIFVIPLGFFCAAGLIAMATGRSFDVEVGPAGLVVLPILAIPIVHFFMSTSRMARAAGNMGHQAPSQV